MSSKIGGNFLTAHYDWIAAAVAVAALAAGGVMFVGSLGTDADALAAAKVREVKDMQPGGKAVEPPDLAEFTRISKVAAKDPPTVPGVADDQASFLASEARVFCTNATCQAAVLKDAKACPVCGVVLERIDPVSLDADGDGMPNDWEKKYGLNPNDPADADLDKDGDGFANAEEFEAKTDPADKMSHPDYLDYVTVDPKLEETVLPFYFTGTYKTPSGLKFQFKDPSRAKEYDRGVYSLVAGEEIGKSGFVPKEYVPKTAKKKVGGGMEKTVDVSEAVVVRKTDGKKVAMTVNRRQVPVDVQAKLAYSRDGGKTFKVVTGETIELNGTKYVVKEIGRTEKGVKVTLVHGTLGKARVVSSQPLEP